MNEPELSGLLERGPTADDAVLHEIVRRRDHRRTRRVRELAVAAAVVALALVGSTVALTRNGAAPRDAIGATPAPTSGAALLWRAAPTTAPRSAAAPSSAIAAPAFDCATAAQQRTACTRPLPTTPLIARAVDGISISASLAPSAVGVPEPAQPDVSPASTVAPALFGCSLGSTLDVTVSLGSTTQHLFVKGPRAGGAAVESVTTALISGANRHGAVVVVRTSAPTDTVAARFADGRRDAMQAVDGWAVLVDAGPARALTGTFGSLTVTTATGKEVTAVTLDRLPGVAYPGLCLRPQPTPKNHTPSVTPG